MKFPYLKFRLGESATQPIRPRPFIGVKVRAHAQASDFLFLYALIELKPVMNMNR